MNNRIILTPQSLSEIKGPNGNIFLSINVCYKTKILWYSRKNSYPKFGVELRPWTNN